MPYNPSTSRAECNYHAGLVNQDSKNQPQTSNRESYNTFDKRHLVFDTQLFDEVRPFYMDPANSGDVKRARIINNDWSPVTKSQVLSTITKHRALFQVPWSVIMPNTWEYIFREPVQGSDINPGNVLPLLGKKHFRTLLHNVFYWNITNLPSPVSFEYVFKAVWLFYNMFGASGLPHSLGVRILKPSAFLFLENDSSVKYDCSPESVFSRLCEAFGNGVKVTVGGSGVSLSLPNVFRFKPDVASSAPDSSFADYVYEIQSASDMFNFIRDFIWYSRSGSLGFSGSVSVADFRYLLAYVLFGVVTYSSEPEPNYIASLYEDTIEPRVESLPVDFVYNVAPLIAYQCVWHQFYTNDRIDAIYSARMWQENILTALIDKIVPGQSTLNGGSFTLNGIRVFYDAYSAAYFTPVLSTSTVITADSFLWLDYFNELFSVRPSMRGSDYFTSMRAQPLAVGDVNVSVNSNIVSAIDINKSLWYQRFLNAVNRTKQSIYDYLQSITGVLPQRREPQPNFILEETYKLTGMEVENNADKQGSIVSLLRNTSSEYMYDVFIDEPSFVLGLDSYNVNYVYPDSCHKISQMSDRLDWFNDFMQHIGDQQVSVRELFTPSSLSTIDNPIGYQLRYAEFKNMVSRASGGFIVPDSDLASWLLMYNPSQYLGFTVNEMSLISPYFIRNHAADFDKLFASLTGNSPATRYHVIKAAYIDEFDNSKQQSYPSLL